PGWVAPNNIKTTLSTWKAIESQMISIVKDCIVYLVMNPRVVSEEPNFVEGVWKFYLLYTDKYFEGELELDETQRVENAITLPLPTFPIIAGPPWIYRHWSDKTKFLWVGTMNDYEEAGVGEPDKVPLSDSEDDPEEEEPRT